ncbi:C4-dicarboxylate TRAP transporter substrate-binding protein [Telmatospirillum sp. J64-1]|uniref:C4-dicarboxylate TRAP transporter substrate-binding protein n=1 Tax=Telmatospirillum sp. J64-1 TaxID=2502183 RepID=UPI001C8F229A|nr:C4-dicarboxylate TRAP transporter substrate-binding protein [Telmatospirillum sp. J64-1]
MMHVRNIVASCGLAALVSTGATAANATETIRLTIASSHPTTIHWVGVMDNVFKPEVNRILEENGGNYQIQWTEAYGGSLYRYRETLSAVREGITDIGWIGTLWEGSALPLQNVTYYTPFITDDLSLVLKVMDDIQSNVPEIRSTWENNGVVFLGGAGTDSYHLWTKFPINSLEDLRGRRISAPGVSATWLEGTGAVPVDGGLTTYYTDIQTGVSEGTLSFATGILPTKVHEVAPYITKVSLGAMYLGAVGINKDRWDSLPEEVQKALVEAGHKYREALAEEIESGSEAALQQMEKEGAKISVLPEEERLKWVNAMPNIAQKWVADNEAKSLPAGMVLQRYLDGIRAASQTLVRDWDKQ